MVGDAWFNQQLPLLFPEDAALRRATFLAHIASDTGPIQSQTLTQFLLPAYMDEIGRLETNLGDDGAEHRAKRLGDYILVLWIADLMPDTIMDVFLARAPTHVRRHSIGYLGRMLQLPQEELPEENRARARRLWEMRLGILSIPRVTTPAFQMFRSILPRRMSVTLKDGLKVDTHHLGTRALHRAA
jgi:hypothetical protein